MKFYLGDDKYHECQGYGVMFVRMANGMIKQIQNVMLF
jgi:hypothetical protein